jgi:hypothetical protein
VVCLRLSLSFVTRSGLISSAVALAVGCNGSSSTNTGVGDLVFVINGPAAAVNVAGPNAYSQNLSASGTLATIATGQYVITANPAPVPDPIVSQVDTGVVLFDVTGDSGSSITMTLNNNTIDTIVVNYGPRPGSGYLYTSSQTTTVLNRINGYYSQQLQDLGSAGSPASAISVDGRPGQGAPGPLAVDLSGDLWVGTQTGQISEYPYSQLLTGTTTGPTGTTNTVPAAVLAMAFDPAGNLWVAIPGEVLEFTAGNLGGTPKPYPVPQLTSAPAGLAFDNLGNLWVAESGTGTLTQLGSAYLAGTGGSPIVASTGQPVSAPLFDSQGRLWVVATNNVVLGYSALQSENFTSTTTPATSFAINTSGTATAAAFDNGLDLWVAEGSNVVEISSTVLTTGGTQTPIATLTAASGLSNTTGLTFLPKGQFLPLAGSHVAPVLTSKGHRLGRAGL